jgi:hypothetical protein
MHVLEVYGAEGCCDGTTTWKFRVNNDKWEDFTVPNLNKYGKATKKLNRPKPTTDPVEDFCKTFNKRSYVTKCANMNGKHYEKLMQGFAQVNVCAVLVKTSKKSCAAYCKSQDRMCLFGIKNRVNGKHKKCSPAPKAFKKDNKNGCNGKWEWSMCGCS